MAESDFTSAIVVPAPTYAAEAPPLDSLPGTKHLKFTGGVGVGEKRWSRDGLANADAGCAFFCSLEADDTPVALLARIQSVAAPETFYEIWVFRSTSTLRTFRLRKRVAGASTILAQAILGGYLAGDVLEVRFGVRGTDIQVDQRIAGAASFSEVMMARDSSISGAGKSGFLFQNFLGGPQVARIDNWRDFRTTQLSGGDEGNWTEKQSGANPPTFAACAPGLTGAGGSKHLFFFSQAAGSESRFHRIGVSQADGGCALFVSGPTSNDLVVSLLARVKSSVVGAETWYEGWFFFNTGLWISRIRKRVAGLETSLVTSLGIAGASTDVREVRFRAVAGTLTLEQRLAGAAAFSVEASIVDADIVGVGDVGFLHRPFFSSQSITVASFRAVDASGALVTGSESDFTAWHGQIRDGGVGPSGAGSGRRRARRGMGGGGATPMDQETFDVGWP